MSETKSIYQSLAGVMQDVSAVAKNQKNQQQGFRFRGIDDVYNAVHPLLAKHGVFTTPEVLSERTEERKTAKGGILIYRILTMRYTFFGSDGSSVVATVIGEGMDSGDKATNKAMAVAHKYALLQTLCIPTEDIPDPDSESHPESTPVKPAAVKLDAPAVASRKQLVGEIVELYKGTAFSDEDRSGLRGLLSALKTLDDLRHLKGVAIAKSERVVVPGPGEDIPNIPADIF